MKTMSCTDVQELLPGMALGDVDAEAARSVEGHLSGCEGCRAGRASVDATVAMLGAANPVSPSSERRLSAVNAMTKARGEEVERLHLRSRWPWVAAGAVAAALILAVVAIVFQSPSGPEYRVMGVAGRVDVYRSDQDRYVPLEKGDVVRSGDRIMTQSHARVLLDLQSGVLLVDQYTNLAVTRAGRILLESGRLYAEINISDESEDLAAQPLEITDTANNSISIR